MDDELDPRPQPMGPKNLEEMSVFELEEYIEDLKAEIIRAEENKKQKQASKEAADSIFK
jgi:uncharacterized small protein (DUF1192 family)